MILITRDIIALWKAPRPFKTILDSEYRTGLSLTIKFLLTRMSPQVEWLPHVDIQWEPRECLDEMWLSGYVMPSQIEQVKELATNLVPIVMRWFPEGGNLPLPERLSSRMIAEARSIWQGILHNNRLELKNGMFADRYGLNWEITLPSSFRVRGANFQNKLYHGTLALFDMVTRGTLTELASLRSLGLSTEVVKGQPAFVYWSSGNHDSIELARCFLHHLHCMWNHALTTFKQEEVVNNWLLHRRCGYCGRTTDRLCEDCRYTIDAKLNNAYANTCSTFMSENLSHIVCFLHR